MSKLNIFLLALLVVLLFWAQTDNAAFLASTINPTPTIVPTATPTPTPTLAPPVFFNIPKIGVAAPIEPVGTDSEGKMELPTELDQVGWYQLGYKPGEPGHAVIAGHLDSATGAGAIFYRLHELEPGDDMTVTTADNQLLDFIVTDKKIYPFDQVPMAEVFGSTTDRMLNLITCTGWWNATTHNYSHRMVIFSKLSQ